LFAISLAGIVHADEKLSHYPPTTPAPPAFSSQSSVTSPAASAQPTPDSTAQKTEKKLTLEEAINMALPGHPKIQAATQNLRAGRFNTLAVQSAFWPQLSFDASRSYVWSENISRVTIPTLPPKVRTTDNFNQTATDNYGFNANWILFDFGRTYFNVRSSKSLEKALMDNLNTAEQTVAYDIMDAYYNLLKFQSLVEVAHETLDDANAHLKQAQAFYDVGTKPKFDVTQAEVQVNNAKVLVIQSEDAVKVARVNLNTRIGIDPLAPTNVEDRPVLEPLDTPMEVYMQQAIANRPDLKSLEEIYHSNEMQVKSQMAGFLPIITASASYGWNKQDGGLFEQNDGRFLDNSGVMIAADIPIFSGFNTVARVGQARANMLSSKYTIEDTKNDILNQVGISYIAIQDAGASYEGFKTTVRSARENLDIANGRYEAGVGAILDVTDAQVSLTTAESNLAQAFYNYHLAFSKLLRTTGTPPRNQK